MIHTQICQVTKFSLHYLKQCPKCVLVYYLEDIKNSNKFYKIAARQL